MELEDGAQTVEEPAQLTLLGRIRPLLGQVRHPPMVEPEHQGARHGQQGDDVHASAAPA
ncbi:hypothetical protein KYC5002_19600 [Archangium violaceum]|uniref:hypothetical protein n=1 Tax=Archangium violaceum TaxID=83451 RepID=UPI002B30298F|nr:hypothetical protein KYC5002_19600 [Archangium gephyra]